MNDEKFLFLSKKYITESMYNENIIINLLKILTDKNGIFPHLNKILKDQISRTFLGSYTYLLNYSIRNDFLSTRNDKKI